jgi:5'-deoxynucleotidase YfbR-like HD superfamily hydrolase
MSNFMMTNSHKQFNYENITAESIDIMDIAHSLSNICRFGGHIDEFYSVAQHSVFVSYLVPDEHRLAALLHDASEAYLGDIISPLKKLLPDYRALEEKVMAGIEKKFGFVSDDIIKIADAHALYAEGIYFYGSVKNWDIDSFRCSYRIEPVCQKEAKKLFLDRYAELVAER